MNFAGLAFLNLHLRNPNLREITPGRVDYVEDKAEARLHLRSNSPK
ncbi:hypothetical protein MOX02_61680 [Methylobacterium oxalidis]|uniref:Uncharacterized protein n=1 Tax=Methylobacterium oxalidis TaxID=944322 RepID=A0A512JDV5_9HYPH|nr:hypothetical protein MOX02_61680 [Methylobacterium oxalidis]GLS62494.1 hypothetical protein GCM10007888_08750 [Methylobacterium oxalidis]